MASAPVPERMSVLEYLEAEQIPDRPRHEYVDGEVFEMEAATPAHAALVVRIGGLLDVALHRRCKVYTGLRLYPMDIKYLYPDVMVICGPEQLHPIKVPDDETVENACLIVEVLSKKTQDYDHGRKFDWYRKISSFSEYLLVSQWERRIEYRSREGDDDWRIHYVRDGTLSLRHVGVELSVEDIYFAIV